MIRIQTMAATLVAAAGLVAPAHLAAQTIQNAPTVSGDDFSIHGQATLVVQGTPGFASPYQGTNSLTPDQVKETVDITLYAGVRPWKSGELWINPEIDQGFGLSNTLGAAGFPSAEAYKVGRPVPYFRLQRLFFRQTFGLGGDNEEVASVANQFGGTRDRDRVVITAGKIGVGDIFDTNTYAHDPRGDFLNWSVVDAGSFDYAADAWGYSTGIAAEWYRGAWTLRGGAFNLSRVPNGETLEQGFDQYQLDAEVEHRHEVLGRPGAVRVTVFRNRGRFSRFDDAVALARATGNAVDPALTRERRSRMGVHVNMEQAVSDTVGVFARAGIADGSIEPYDFTDIDRSAQIGGMIGGRDWGRPRDTVGLAVVVNGISRSHQRYLDAGGYGVLIGDGRLPRPGSEFITEAYYKLAALGGIDLTLDYQLIVNPGYNRDRGPANVFAFRVHGAF